MKKKKKQTARETAGMKSCNFKVSQQINFHPCQNLSINRGDDLSEVGLGLRF